MKAESTRSIRTWAPCHALSVEKQLMTADTGCPDLQVKPINLFQDQVEKKKVYQIG